MESGTKSSEIPSEEEENHLHNNKLGSSYSNQDFEHLWRMHCLHQFLLGQIPLLETGKEDLNELQPLVSVLCVFFLLLFLIKKIIEAGCCKELVKREGWCCQPYCATQRPVSSAERSPPELELFPQMRVWTLKGSVVWSRDSEGCNWMGEGGPGGGTVQRWRARMPQLPIFRPALQSPIWISLFLNTVPRHWEQMLTELHSFELFFSLKPFIRSWKGVRRKSLAKPNSLPSLTYRNQFPTQGNIGSLWERRKTL